MDIKLDRKLYKLAPHLFAGRYGDMRETAMGWGFECGNGWYKIIEEAAKKLEPLIVAVIAKDPKAWEFGYYRATQIKEKFGTLRFYSSGGTKEMQDIMDKAMKQSSKICEVCGKPGKLRDDGWLYTRCTACWKKDRKYA